jgi:hypothetical protein
MRAQTALDEFLRQPRSRLVWRQVVEPIPVAPRTVLVTVDPETAQQWLRRKVSPAEPDPARARQYAELMATGSWHPRDDEPVGQRASFTVEATTAATGESCVCRGSCWRHRSRCAATGRC